MLLKSLEIHCFRNLKGHVDWGNNLNIIWGENGQGKTNWLESIYLLATSKSFRTQRLQEAIKFNESLSVISGVVTRSHEVSRELQVVIQGNTKSLLVNSKRESLSQYLGQLHTIAFTASELEIVRGTPEARRKFLDRGIISLHPSYLQTLANFHRVIKQKNRLLQAVGNAELPMNSIMLKLEPWNEQLIALSAEIFNSRSEYVDRLGKSLKFNLFSNDELSIHYVSSLEGKGDISNYKSLLAERLHIRIQAEVSAGYALIGPHRDELKIMFNGRDVRMFGSSGQQRSALILLDLAAISVYHTWHGEYPLFLMDDADAELDRKHISSLIDYLQGGVQTFVTTSKDNLIKDYQSQADIYEVIEGKINNISSLNR